MMTNHTQCPQYLCHYTSIEALALILKTRTVRLQRLDKVNDPTEEICQDGKLGKYLFVTCWTSEQQEFLPFWYMYGHNKRGVRIRLPIDFLKCHKVREQVHRPDGTVTTNGKYFDSVIPEEELLCSDYLVSNFNAESNRFFPVEYTDDPAKLVPHIFSNRDDGSFEAAFGLLGKHKPTIWSFEQEWRFRLVIYPFGIHQIDPECPSFARRAIEEKKELAFADYFLQIADEAYSQMEITLGPLCTEGDRTIAEALTQKYNPGAALVSSVLKVR